MLLVRHVLSLVAPPRPRFFFFHDTATTEIYTLSLHDALPICGQTSERFGAAQAHCELENLQRVQKFECRGLAAAFKFLDRKSTRLNSSHRCISYAVFCLKKKKKKKII